VPAEVSQEADSLVLGPMAHTVTEVGSSAAKAGDMVAAAAALLSLSSVGSYWHLLVPCRL
jgi:hypothetical protein